MSKGARQRSGKRRAQTRSRKPGKHKQPVEVVRIAMALGRRHLLPYGSDKSRHDFTRPQRMTRLGAARVLDDTCRGVIGQPEVEELIRIVARRTLRR